MKILTGNSNRNLSGKISKYLKNKLVMYFGIDGTTDEINNKARKFDETILIGQSK